MKLEIISNFLGGVNKMILEKKKIASNPKIRGCDIHNKFCIAASI